MLDLYARPAMLKEKFGKTFLAEQVYLDAKIVKLGIKHLTT